VRAVEGADPEMDDPDAHLPGIEAGPPDGGREPVERGETEPAAQEASPHLGWVRKWP
jgi:hypothetical protein